MAQKEKKKVDKESERLSWKQFETHPFVVSCMKIK